MFTTVAVPLDESPRSETALDPARAVATRLDVPIVLVTAAGADDTDECEIYLEGITERLDRPGTTGVVAADREPWAALADALADEKRPLVCMATHGRTGLGRALLGSVAERVVAGVDAPVLLVGPRVDPSGSDAPDLLVVTHDGSDLSASIVPVASELASGLGVPVEVLTVDEGPVGADDGHAAPEGAEHQPAVDLEPVIEGFGAASVVATGVHLRGDDVARTIAEHVADRRTIVCMATHGRSGLRRVALGSVAAQVVHGSSCPVLVARPGGSPATP